MLVKAHFAHFYSTTVYGWDEHQFLWISMWVRCVYFINAMFCLVRQLTDLPYFSAYKTEAFHFQNKPKNLDLSYKMDLDFLDCLGRAKLVL